MLATTVDSPPPRMNSVGGGIHWLSRINQIVSRWQVCVCIRHLVTFPESATTVWYELFLGLLKELTEKEEEPSYHQNKRYASPQPNL